MFISSSTRQKPREFSPNYSLRPLPMKGTNRRNPDEYFVLNGRTTTIMSKPKKYRSNSQLTLSRSWTPGVQETSVTKTELPMQGYNDTASETDTSGELDYQLYTEDFKDEPEPELSRLREDTIYVGDPKETAWFLDPANRSQRQSIDLDELARKSPLQASVIRSNMEGLLYPAPQEEIEKTPVESFDVSLFRSAEDEMLSCRSITALTSPYQYKLAKLRMERLKIEEERLIQLKAISELERIRGPSPRWYELKTPGFHIEAKKNNQMLASSGNYKEIMNYRHELLQTLEKSKMAEST